MRPSKTGLRVRSTQETHIHITVEGGESTACGYIVTKRIKVTSDRYEVNCPRCCERIMGRETVEERLIREACLERDAMAGTIEEFCRTRGITISLTSVTTLCQLLRRDRTLGGKAKTDEEIWADGGDWDELTMDGA